MPKLPSTCARAVLELTVVFDRRAPRPPHVNGTGWLRPAPSRLIALTRPPREATVAHPVQDRIMNLFLARNGFRIQYRGCRAVIGTFRGLADRRHVARVQSERNRRGPDRPSARHPSRASRFAHAARRQRNHHSTATPAIFRTSSSDKHAFPWILSSLITPAARILRHEPGPEPSAGTGGWGTGELGTGESNCGHRNWRTGNWGTGKRAFRQADLVDARPAGIA